MHHHHNRIYVAWDNATGSSSSDKNGNNVVLSHSDDGGVTFTAPVIGQRTVQGQDRRYRRRPGRRRRTARCTSPGRTTRTTRSSTSPRSTAGSRSGRGTSSPSVGAFSVPPGGSGVTWRARLSRLRSDRRRPVTARTWTNRTKSQDRVRRQVGRRRLDVELDSHALAPATSSTSGSPSTQRTARSTSPTTTPGTPGNCDDLHAGPLDERGRRYTATPVANATTDESGGEGVNLGNQYGDYEDIAALGGTVRPAWTDRQQDVIELRLARRGVHGRSRLPLSDASVCRRASPPADTDVAAVRPERGDALSVQ